MEAKVLSVGFIEMGLAVDGVAMDGTQDCIVHRVTSVSHTVIARDIESLFGPSSQREMPPERTTKKARSARSIREDLLLAALERIGMEEIEKRILEELKKEVGRDEAEG